MPEYQGPKCKKDLKKHNLIKALKLTDASISPECLIDKLTESDKYLSFVTR